MELQPCIYLFIFKGIYLQAVENIFVLSEILLTDCENAMQIPPLLGNNF